MSVLHSTGQRRFLCLPDRPTSQHGPPTRELVLTSTVDPPGSATWRLTSEVRLRLPGPLTVHATDGGSLPAGACDSLTALTAVRAMLTYALEGPWPALFDSPNPRTRLPACGALDRPLLTYRAARHRVPCDRRLSASDPWTALCHYRRNSGALAPSASTLEVGHSRPLLSVLTARRLTATRSDHSPHLLSPDRRCCSSALSTYRCSPTWGRRHLARSTRATAI